uniref:Uncharacterized protein n=1 Tax=Arundo donax TaxID=35708 RepID=A0A0A9AFJ6_ARUDO
MIMSVSRLLTPVRRLMALALSSKVRNCFSQMIQFAFQS